MTYVYILWFKNNETNKEQLSKALNGCYGVAITQHIATWKSDGHGVTKAKKIAALFPDASFEYIKIRQARPNEPQFSYIVDKSEGFLEAEQVLYKEDVRPYTVEFKYADEYSSWDWRTVTCTIVAHSINDAAYRCVQKYELDKYDRKYAIVSVKPEH